MTLFQLDQRAEKILRMHEGDALAVDVARLFPVACLAALLALPLLVASARRARNTYTRPRDFVPAIRSIVACYAVAVTLFTMGVLIHGLVR